MNHRKPIDRAGSGQPDQKPKDDGAKVPRRRSRLPLRADLHLDDDLPANVHHRLGNSAPEARTASRQRVIGSVLARLARADVKRRA